MAENGNETKRGEKAYCSHCGCELPADALLCPQCGKEIVQISAVDVLEDELLKGLVDEKPQDGETQEETPSETVEEQAAEEEPVVEDPEEVQKKKRRRLTILIIVIVVVVVAAIVGTVIYQNHSTNHLLRAAQRQYNRHNYENAIDSLDKLFALDEDNVEGLILAGESYAALHEYDEAEAAFLRAIELDPDNIEAYTGLLDLYDAEGNSLKIVALKKTVTNEDILALFDDYLIPSPEILTEGGTFDDYFTVELKNLKKDGEIYYTLDGTTPTDRSLLYSEPIKIDTEGTTVLTAVCIDNEGNYSDTVSETYVIKLPVPDMPVATPDGGEFTTETLVDVTVPEDSVVYYTWDNGTPTENSNVYTEPIRVPEGNNVLSLIAINSFGKQSAIQRYNFVYYPETSVQTYVSEETDDNGTQSTESTDTINGVQPEVTTTSDTEETADTTGDETDTTQNVSENNTGTDNGTSDNATESKSESTGWEDDE